MKILFAAADVGALFGAGTKLNSAFASAFVLEEAGHEVSVVAPWTAALNHLSQSQFEPVPTGVRLSDAEVFEVNTADGMQVFLLKAEALFETVEFEFSDGAAFAKLIIELARHLDPMPDILQVQDGPGALVLSLAKADRLPITGVLDSGTWSPCQDHYVASPYSTDSLSNKEVCANAFLPELGLAKKNEGAAVYLLRKPGGVTQKEIEHWDLFTSGLDHLLVDDVRLLVIGDGELDPQNEQALQVAAKKYPLKVKLLPDRADFWHQALAASDFALCLDKRSDLEYFLLRSMRYGCIPVVPQEGSRALTPKGTLPFYNLTSSGLFDTLFKRARVLMQPNQSAELERIRQTAMDYAGSY